MNQLEPKSTVEEFIRVWHTSTQTKNLDLMKDWVTQDIILYSPALFHPKKGRAEVEPLLRDVLDALQGYHVTKLGSTVQRSFLSLKHP